MNTSVIVTQIIAVLTILSGVLFAARKLISTAKAGRIDQKAELDAAMSLGGKIRDELRKDNEALRMRVAVLEGHVNTLDKEISELKKINDECRQAREEAVVQVRILKRYLSSQKPDLDIDSVTLD
jgi:cell division protein FtsB